MGKQQNRVSKKWAFSSISASNSKNRVALGEITNLVNLDSGFDDKTPAPKLKKKGIKLVVDLTDSDTSGQPDFEAGSGDGLRKCGSSSLIYQHLHSLEMEEKRRPLSDYLEKVQMDLTPGMREILVDWLVEVAEEYKLVSDTLYLTISYVDRFLSSRAMNRNHLQLLGVSSMLIASKHEEISPPHLEDFCYITDNTYTKEEVVDMEKEILKFLSFEISSPTTKTFLRIFTRAAEEYSPQLDLKFEFLAAYLAELSLLDYGTVRFLPSMIAASVIFVSKFTMEPKKHPWSVAMQQYSGYKASELKDCVLAIHDLQMHRRGNSSQAIREKYKHQKFQCVSILFSPSEIPQMYLRDYY